MLTGPELRRIFQVGVGEEVPEYEVVNIHHRRHRRSADSQAAVHQVHYSGENILEIQKYFWTGNIYVTAVHMIDALITG